MAEKYTDRIKAFCEGAGIEIPIGFYRHSASRYVVIDTECSPQKLVAKTWFKQEDVVYYLKNLDTGKRVRILDFKDRKELIFEGGERFKLGSRVLTSAFERDSPRSGRAPQFYYKGFPTFKD